MQRAQEQEHAGPERREAERDDELARDLDGHDARELRDEHVEEAVVREVVDRVLDVLRRVRAIQILEQIGSAEAAHVLETLASGTPAARETWEAQASLARLRARVP